MPRKLCVLFLALAIIALPGCGRSPLPAQEGPVTDMRDAIAIAISEGDEAQVKQLLETQPLLLNEPIANLNNSTPLHCAAQANNPALITYLLELGADPYMRDDEGQFPVDIAIARGAGEEVIDLLRVN